MYIASVDHIDHSRISLTLLQKNEVLIDLQLVEEEAGMWRIIGAWLRKSLHARDEAVQKLLLCLLKLNQAILGNLEGARGQQQELTVRQAGGSCLPGGVLVHQGQLAEDRAATRLADALPQVALQGHRADTVQRPHSSRLFPGQWNMHILKAHADWQSWGILISWTYEERHLTPDDQPAMGWRIPLAEDDCTFRGLHEGSHPRKLRQDFGLQTSEEVAALQQGKGSLLFLGCDRLALELVYHGGLLLGLIVSVRRAPPVLDGNRFEAPHYRHRSCIGPSFTGLLGATARLAKLGRRQRPGAKGLGEVHRAGASRSCQHILVLQLPRASFPRPCGGLRRAGAQRLQHRSIPSTKAVLRSCGWELMGFLLHLH
mmetsp:Transcript_56536/g.132642  ORF Transcript_56536/g.132642 Transcript_56536/m.132642 type:complete len:371 (-) Transcript_56536:104-1216(-)